MKFAVLAIVGSVGLLAALPSPTAAAPAPTEKPPTLAFVSAKNRGVIYLLTPDGKAKCLDEDAADKKYGSGTEPSWAPDGRKIAFTRPLGRPIKDDVQVVHMLCVMDADGKNVKQLTNGELADTQAAWSPDGKRIAFHSIRHGQAVI
jgi:TolB protein